MVNRRYAVLGWLTWQVGKRMAARKARSATPGGEGGGRPTKALLAAGLAVAGAAVFFWRRRGEPVDANAVDANAVDAEAADQ